MPFKNVGSPKRVTNLDGAIVASAQLKAGFVGMLSTHSVELAVIPTSGQNPKKTAVGLSQADDLAFISREVAVVRSDGDVWAVLDISHNAKMDQVGRDARSLAMRPAGESALALGWDTRATSFTLKGHEVEGREFALRGDVRAFSMTDDSCYVVVDGTGGEGGELRVHPGASPESGALARAPLPKGAARLDRVRGGKDLCAVYKRGDTNVCAVVGVGSRFEAKMLSLDVPAADVAVAETSLLVATTDGRVLLFDRNAIQGATFSRIEPTSETPVGGSGDPTVLEVTGKGSPTLWMGTSGGDVLSATVVRRQGV
jgi:hypothetical protein